jgi:hypothetical protein
MQLQRNATAKGTRFAHGQVEFRISCSETTGYNIGRREMARV